MCNIQNETAFEKIQSDYFPFLKEIGRECYFIKIMLSQDSLNFLTVDPFRNRSTVSRPILLFY